MFTQTLNGTQIINGIEYTKEQLLQGLAQVRTQYNESTDNKLTDSEFLQYALEQNLSAWYEANKGKEIIAPSPIKPVADWHELKKRCLGGELYPIFQRLTFASLEPSANTISTARGDITDAIISIRIEEALASGLQLLTQIGGYKFTQEEKDLWKKTVDELNFSPLIYLP